MSNKNIKNKINKAKELYDNIDATEKEVIKEAVKELIDVAKDAVEQKKATGKFNKTTLVAIVAGILSLFNVVFTAVQPDVELTVEEAKTEVYEYVNTIDSINTVNYQNTVKNEELGKMITIDENGTIIIGAK